MTPSAVTPAARTKRAAPPRPTSPHPTTPRAAHRAPTRRSPTPRTPRRVSGPARPTPRAPVARAAATAIAVATPAVVPAPRTPRRVRSRPGGREVTVRAIATLRTLPDHALLDRVVRGRLWIPLLGVLLVGIVAMQVEVLKLNASIGTSVVRSTQLQSENQILRAQISTASNDQRVEGEAVGQDMSDPAPTQPLYLGGSESANLTAALRNIHAPNPTVFAAQTAALAQRRADAVVQSSGQ